MPWPVRTAGPGGLPDSPGKSIVDGSNSWSGSPDYCDYRIADEKKDVISMAAVIPARAVLDTTRMADELDTTRMADESVNPGGAGAADVVDLPLSCAVLDVLRKLRPDTSMARYLARLASRARYRSAAGRQAGRRPLRHHNRKLGDRSPRPRPPVLRSRMEGEPAAQADRSGIPGRRAGRRGPARRRRPGLAGQRATEVAADQYHRRVRAEQLTAAQPGRLEGVHRHRRPELRPRHPRPDLRHVLAPVHPGDGET